MVLLRRVIGDALRARRQGQQRTLREVSSAANVSLGYLSEIERGQKEASSELLASICDALGAQLSELLREVSDTVALAEEMPEMLVPVGGAAPARQALPERTGRATGSGSAGSTQPSPALAETAAHKAGPAAALRRVADGNVSVSVRQDSPLKATLRATRRARPGDQDRNRDIVCVG